MPDLLVFGYARPSPDPQVAGVDAQREAIRRYCQQAGLNLHGVSVDPASSGQSWLHEREAGGKLWKILQRGDHLVVVAPHRVADNLTAVTSAMDTLTRRGVVLHFVDPPIVLDPGDPAGRRAVELLSSLVLAGNRLKGVRARESVVRRRQEGKRCSGEAPFGQKFVKRGGKTYLAPAPEEQAILARVGELRAAGYSIDELRQHMAYTWRVRNRRGREFGHEEIRRMCLRFDDIDRATEPGAEATSA
jgi:DNA invertase Pin-like site-specific DNA recombinase